MLDKQVKILSIDTDNFYNDKEREICDAGCLLRVKRNNLINGYFEKDKDGKRVNIDGLKTIKNKLNNKGINIDLILKDKLLIDQYSEEDKILINKYISTNQSLKTLNSQIKKNKTLLTNEISSNVQKNIDTNGKDHIRLLNKDTLVYSDGKIKDKYIISIFDCNTTRTIKAKINEFCDDLMVVKVYYFDILKDLMNYGYMYNNEKYIFFTSSAGQIRTKKVVFIKESTWLKYQKTLMCGLTFEKINEHGGCNPNKFLAYTALNNSATDEWLDFDIDKSIVVDDFETNVYGEFDYINDETYEIKRVTNEVSIPHMDGCGLMLEELGCNKMVRLPFIKGLLATFNFVDFIKEHNCSPIVKDIYGDEHDIIKEGINVIFTKSQFKMYKYYNSWQEYKDYYKLYNCSAGVTNIEEDNIKNATINYQMLQTLTDITHDEILEISKLSINSLNSICDSIDNLQKIFGIKPYNEDLTALQEAIMLYPNLLNDRFLLDIVRKIIKSLVKKYKSGSLKIHGKYTFILPDLYAFCEWLFLKDNNPKGLLNDNEVYCNLFKNSEKLDCLRSPHLFKEHSINKNMAYYKYDRTDLKKWFKSKALYTSCHSLISRILQFDKLTMSNSIER